MLKLRIVAFGNPLLDTTIFVNDNVLLKKYNLEEDGQKEISEHEMKSLNRDIAGYDQFKSAGGCAQNSLRVLQWLMKKKCDAVIFGSVGSDKEANILRELLQNDGVTTRYVVQQHLPTGQTVALVKGPSRSLVAYIGAAEHLLLEDLLAEEDFHDSINHSNLVYIEGFFLTNRTETAKYILDYCNQQNIIVAFNISGEYLCNTLPDTLRYFIENSDVVFGNKREFEAMRKLMKLDSVADLAFSLAENGKNKITQHGNIIVITDGPKMGTCVYGGGKVYEFEVPSINEKDFKDTTGAGDAFTGGFMAGLCKGKSVEDCARIGCYAANQIIRQIGCSLPMFESDKLD